MHWLRRITQRIPTSLFPLPKGAIASRLGEVLRNRPFVQWVIAFCIGLIFADHGLPLIAFPFVGVLLLSLTPKLRWHLLFLLLGWWRYEWEDIRSISAPPTLPSPIRVRVIEDIELIPRGYRTLVQPVDKGGVPLRYRALLYMPRTLDWLPEYGQELLVRTSFHRPEQPKQAIIDWKSYLRRRRIAWVGSVYSSHDLQLLKSPPFSPWYWVLDMRHSIRDSFRSHLSLKDASIMEGLLLGAPGDFPRDLRDAFARAGIVHILTASGLHVAIVAWLLNSLLLRLRCPFRLRLLLLIAGIWFYAILAGWKAPIVRAAIMGTLFVIAPLFRRNGDGLSALAWAAFLWLLYAPGSFWELSFRLSFAAMIGLLLFTAPLHQYLQDTSRKWFGKKPLLESQIWLPLSVTLAAQLGILPVQGFYFGYVSLWAPIANLLAAPSIVLLLASGFLFWLSQGIGDFILTAGCWWLNWIAQTFGGEGVPQIALSPFWKLWLGPLYGLILTVVREPRIEEPEEERIRGNL